MKLSSPAMIALTITSLCRMVINFTSSPCCLKWPLRMLISKIIVVRLLPVKPNVTGLSFWQNPGLAKNNVATKSKVRGALRFIKISPTWLLLRRADHPRVATQPAIYCITVAKKSVPAIDPERGLLRVGPSRNPLSLSDLTFIDATMLSSEIFQPVEVPERSSSRPAASTFDKKLFLATLTASLIFRTRRACSRSGRADHPGKPVRTFLPSCPIIS